jgi:GGDEF domain-containing protein
MSRLRWHIIALIVWMTIFFNIERLDIGSVNTVNLASEVYVVALITVLLPMFGPFRQGPVWLTVAASMVLLAIGLSIDPRPDIGGFNTYLTLAEIFMVAFTGVLAHRTSGLLEEFREAVETMTLSSHGSRLHTLASAHELVQTEMSGSRRRQRPLSLVLLQADATSLNTMMHRFVAELQRSMMQRYVLATAARVISRSLRRTDLIIEDQTPGRLVLLAPETPAESAAVLGERMVQLLQQRLGISASYGVSSFPQHALTFEELLSNAAAGLHAAEQAPEERARAVGEPSEAPEVLALREAVAPEPAPGD